MLSCGAPPPVLRGKYNHTGMMFGDMVTYTCEPAYDLQGDQNITCDRLGEWGKKPCCISECVWVEVQTMSYRQPTLSELVNSVMWVNRQTLQ